MNKWLDAALEVSQDASVLLKNQFTRFVQGESKDRFDVVTEADRSCEKLIVERLSRNFPNHSIIGEEGASVRGSSDYCWYIDPLDGTANFVHKFPFFAVSIALVKAGEPVLGVISDPVRNECFSARKGDGAHLNRLPMRVSPVAQISESMLGTVFPAHARESSGNIYYYQYLDCASHGVRRTGSAALDLAYVACGRLDALWGFGLKPWDYAAGLILVQEAGGRTSDMLGRPADISCAHLLANNGLLHNQLLSAFQKISAENGCSIPSPRINDY
ncbi:MAG TPA: inositol monophosphatase family protein [Bryobacteraceae bacterium]|nr:inositol monophosphatase family protein [Bryobacteraceae bacterium]